MAQAVLLSGLRSLVPPSRRLLRWGSGDRLFVAMLALSILLHALALAVRFRPFDLDRRDRQSPPLEVALVNAKSQSKPTNADVLAQANLDGGGNTDAKRRAKSPLPMMPTVEPAAEVTVAPEPEPMVRPEPRQQTPRELLSKLQAVPDALAEAKPAPTPEPIDKPVEPERRELPSAGEIVSRTSEAVRLEAQISRSFDAYQQRPKRRFIGARSREYRFARYVEDWRMKVERVGNQHYPEAARQQRLYGSLLATVSIRADGSVESVEINRTSGHRVLDAAAVRIIELAAPFSQFPPDIRRDTDIIHVTRTWTFARGDSFTGQ